MLDSIESAIEDIKTGKIVIVVDDEDRENEGDFIIAARHASPEVVNFMSKHGRGLICAALVEDRRHVLGEGRGGLVIGREGGSGQGEDCSKNEFSHRLILPYGRAVG